MLNIEIQNRGDRRKCEKKDKGIYKNQNILGSFFFWREVGDGFRVVNVLDLLFVFVQKKYYGIIGLD